MSRPPGGDLSSQRPRSAELDAIRYIFDTNFFGVITVTNALLPLLRRSTAPRIVNVSSSAGSLAHMSDPELAADHPISAGYAPSKSALTALTVQYAGTCAPTASWSTPSAPATAPPT